MPMGDLIKTGVSFNLKYIRKNSLESLKYN